MSKNPNYLVQTVEIRRQYKYPYHELKIGESFFIPATSKNPTPWKSQGSTVNWAKKRFAPMWFISRKEMLPDGTMGVRIYRTEDHIPKKKVKSPPRKIVKLKDKFKPEKPKPAPKSVSYEKLLKRMDKAISDYGEGQVMEKLAIIYREAGTAEDSTELETNAKHRQIVYAAFDRMFIAKTDEFLKHEEHMSEMNIKRIRKKANG